MPTHDIIDNRHERLVDHINRILTSTEAGRFAVGYFFLSGFIPIGDRLKALGRIYHQHNMREWPDRKSIHTEDHPIPRIICSEALV